MDAGDQGGAPVPNKPGLLINSESRFFREAAETFAKPFRSIQTSSNQDEYVGCIVDFLFSVFMVGQMADRTETISKLTMKKELALIEKQTRVLMETLSKVNYATIGALSKISTEIVCQTDIPGIGLNKLTIASRGALEILLEAAKAAVPVGSKKSGARINNTKIYVAIVCAEVFYHMTGRRPSVSTDPYTGKPRGKYYILVRDLFEICGAARSAEHYAAAAAKEFKVRISLENRISSLYTGRGSSATFTSPSNVTGGV